MSFEKPPVIIDNGSHTIKAGFACDNHPVSIFRTAVGRPSYLNGTYGKEPYDVFVGDEALEQADDLEISYPVVKGRIVHWDNMERIFHHVLYRELKVAPEDRAIMLALTARTPMSEKYDKVEIAPVYEGGIMSYAQTTTNIPNPILEDYIGKLLAERNIIIDSRSVLQELKMNAYITKNAAFHRKNGKRSFTLPDGQVIDISNEAFMGGEVLFQPDLAIPGVDVMSIPSAVNMSAEMCDPELRAELLDGVVPCGGMSMIPGLCPRLKQDLESLTGGLVNVYSSDEAYCLSWLGGATFAGMESKLWVTKKQFEDFGEKIIKNKFS